MGDGDSFITSRPELFFGKAMTSRIVSSSARIEFLLHLAEEFQSRGRLGVSHHSEAIHRLAVSAVAGAFRRVEHSDVGQSQLMGHLVAHAVPGGVEVGVGRIDRHVAAKGLDRHLLHCVVAREALEPAEDQRMV